MSGCSKNNPLKEVNKLVNASPISDEIKKDENHSTVNGIGFPVDENDNPNISLILAQVIRKLEGEKAIIPNDEDSIIILKINNLIKYAKDLKEQNDKDEYILDEFEMFLIDYNRVLKGIADLSIEEAIAVKEVKLGENASYMNEVKRKIATTLSREKKIKTSSII